MGQSMHFHDIRRTKCDSRVPNCANAWREDNFSQKNSHGRGKLPQLAKPVEAGQGL